MQPRRSPLPLRPQPPPPLSPSANGRRPLSDIRESTEPNLLEAARRKGLGIGATSPGAVRTPDRHRIPEERVPPRSSSRQRHQPTSRAQVPRRCLQDITNTNEQRSPVKEAAERLRTGQGSLRRPSKTINRVHELSSGHDLLDHPFHYHHRVIVNLEKSAPLFVGGSSVEGLAQVVVDGGESTRRRKLLRLEKMSVDLLGVEEISSHRGTRRHIFLHRANAIIDSNHPPPTEMCEGPSGLVSSSWSLLPSSVALRFLISLPLEVGPPPFSSKHARIRYVISATLQISDAGRPLCVRVSQDTALLSVYDPERALRLLPSPLMAQNDWLSHDRRDSVTVEAGLHRSVWVSGQNILADILIANNSHKPIRRLELQLEQVILRYGHAAATSLEISASHSRLFDESERDVVCKNTMKPGDSSWYGVPPGEAKVQTCELQLPRGHATIRCNKYFEVRYYLNAIVRRRHTALVKVQLPITLIHMNSLDVPTNCVSQVAAAIEEKRKQSGAERAPVVFPGTTTTTEQGSPRRIRTGTTQGHAFSAPRDDATDRRREFKDELRSLQDLVDASPRKRNVSVARETRRRGRVIADGEADELRDAVSRVTVRI